MRFIIQNLNLIHKVSFILQAIRIHTFRKKYTLVFNCIFQSKNIKTFNHPLSKKVINETSQRIVYINL